MTAQGSLNVECASLARSFTDDENTLQALFSSDNEGRLVVPLAPNRGLDLPSHDDFEAKISTRASTNTSNSITTVTFYFDDHHQHPGMVPVQVQVQVLVLVIPTQATMKYAGYSSLNLTTFPLARSASD
ncbi:hypothetical protein CTA1_2530 [Colletotrichum tanaceti]|uniref:Uncharacterized protein n=1 Tax=Colletotrichum tanaceti TaxID=1306861 RepID=A0A4U6X6C9_9PEZI|nr:hypothetical protein CTA1_2530 [Colletotrichum tanaceti]